MSPLFTYKAAISKADGIRKLLETVQSLLEPKTETASEDVPPTPSVAPPIKPPATTKHLAK